MYLAYDPKATKWNIFEGGDMKRKRKLSLSLNKTIFWADENVRHGNLVPPNSH